MNLFLLSMSSPALAGVYGWLWNDCSTSSCTPSSLYQENSSGGSNSTTRLSAGYYEVLLPGIASGGGNAQVTAYGTDGSCQVDMWYPSGADQVVLVACYDAAGAPADNMFDLLFYDHGTWTAPNPVESGYAWSDQAAPVGKHFAPSLYRYNSAGGRVSITQVFTGTYDVQFPNMRRRNIVPMVTAYGVVPARCAALDWFGQGKGLAVRVECTDLTGALLDTQFSIAVTAGSAPADADSNLPFLGGGLSVDGFGAVNTTESWYDVTGYADTDVTVSRTGPGEFDVTLPGLAPYYDTFIVTAQPSAIGTRCNVGYWFPDGYDTVMHVDCFDGLGTPYDAGFTVVWQTSAL